MARLSLEDESIQRVKTIKLSNVELYRCYRCTGVKLSVNEDGKNSKSRVQGRQNENGSEGKVRREKEREEDGRRRKER